MKRKIDKVALETHSSKPNISEIRLNPNVGKKNPKFPNIEFLDLPRSSSIFLDLPRSFSVFLDLPRSSSIFSSIFLDLPRSFPRSFPRSSSVFLDLPRSSSIFLDLPRSPRSSSIFLDLPRSSSIFLDLPRSSSVFWVCHFAKPWAILCTCRGHYVVSPSGENYQSPSVRI